MGKPTKAKLIKRVSVVSGLLLRGASRGVILQYASEKTDWNVTERTVDSYIAAATKEIAENAETDLSFEVGKAKNRYEYLWQKAVTRQDFSEARHVQKDRSALLGLDAPEKSEVKGEVIIRYESNSDNTTEDAPGPATDKNGKKT